MLLVAWILLVAFTATVVLVFYEAFVIIMISDLEADLINCVDFCKILNRFAAAEHIIYGFVFISALATLSPLIILAHIPILVYNLNKMRNMDVFFDQTEAFALRGKYNREAVAKFFGYLALVFMDICRIAVIILE